MEVSTPPRVSSFSFDVRLPTVQRFERGVRRNGLPKGFQCILGAPFSYTLGACPWVSWVRRLGGDEEYPLAYVAIAVKTFILRKYYDSRGERTLLFRAQHVLTTRCSNTSPLCFLFSCLVFGLKQSETDDLPGTLRASLPSNNASVEPPAEDSETPQGMW